MNQPTLPKHFIFNEKINGDYLFSLYADDYPYMEEVFSVTLQHLDQDIAFIEAAYAGGSVADLKKGVHKVKPAFGFVGLTEVQQLCADFEAACLSASETDELRTDYKHLMAALEEGKMIIAAECRKLKDFNANPL